MSHSSTISIPEFATGVRWRVLTLVALASASAYLTRYCISAANTTIQQDMGLNDQQMGQLMSGFAFGYFLCQVPGGWLGNRLGTRLTLALLSVCWSLSNAWSAVAFGFSSLWASRLSLGIFQAGMVPVSAKILRDWLPLSLRGFSSALLASCMSLGGAFTLWLTGYLLARSYDWRALFAAYSLVGIAWAVSFYWYFRTFPEQHSGVNEAELAAIRECGDGDVNTGPGNGLPKPPSIAMAHPELSPRDLLWRMLTSISLWGICIQSFFRAAGYIFFVTWFFAFLEYAYGIDKAEAGLLNSLPLIAVVLGSLSGGIIVDSLWRLTGSKRISRAGTAGLALAVCSLFTLSSAWTASAGQLSVLMAAGAFFSGLGNPAAWAATIDLGGPHTAPVFGIMNMAGSLSGILLPWILGEWFHQLRHDGGDWNQVIYLHAGFYVLAAASWLIVDPSKTIGAPNDVRQT